MTESQNSIDLATSTMSLKQHIWLIVGLCILVFGQTVFFGFITYDDPEYSYANEHIRGGLTVDGIRWAVSFEAAQTHSNWIPLTFISLMLDAEFYGDRAGGYHLTNLLLHVANSILLYLLFHKLTARPTESFVIAIVFAVHPLHVESVAWVTERKDVLSTFFGFLSLLSYAHWTVSKNRTCFVGALTCFGLSLLAKQTLVTLPFLLLLLDFWPLRRLSTQTIPLQPAPESESPSIADRRENGPNISPAMVFRLVTEKLPFFALTIVFVTTVYCAQQNAMPKDIGWVTRCANAGITYLLYVKHSICPFGLSIFYPHPGGDTSVTLGVLSWLTIMAISTLAILQFRKRPFLLVGWFWFLGTLVPMIGLVQVGDQQMADRYMYVPQTGLALVIVWSVREVADRRNWSRQLVHRAVAGLLAVLTCVAILQTFRWRDSLILYRHTLAHTTDNATIQHLMAACLAERREWTKASFYFTRACELDPRNATMAANYGSMLANEGRNAEARTQLLRAIALQEHHPNARFVLASLDEKAGHLESAIAHARVAFEAHSESPQLVVMLSRLLMLKSEFVESEQLLRHAVLHSPGDAELWSFLGFVLLETDRPQEAVDCFETSIRCDPINELARTGLSQAVKSARDQDEK